MFQSLLKQLKFERFAEYYANLVSTIRNTSDMRQQTNYDMLM